MIRRLINQNGITITIASSIAILFVLFLYSRFTSPENPVFLSPNLYNFASTVLVSFFVCILLLIFGALTTIFTQRPEKNKIIYYLSTFVFADRKSRLVFISSSIVYFIFFGFLTNMFIIFNEDGTVYSLIPPLAPMAGSHNHSMSSNSSNSEQNSPTMNMDTRTSSNDVGLHESHSQNPEQQKGVNNIESDPIFLQKSHYPDFRLVICCNNFGYVPMITIYVSSTFSFLIIPLNFFLGIVISILVGINVALNIFVLKGMNRRVKNFSKSRIFGGLGLTTGLLVGCPTCAGSLLYSIVGFSSLVTFSSLGLYQILFIVVSIPFLILSIAVMARIMYKNNCDLQNR